MTEKRWCDITVGDIVDGLLVTDVENNEDCTFLEAQLQHLNDYKKLLGDQIKKLVDET